MPHSSPHAVHSQPEPENNPSGSFWLMYMYRACHGAWIEHIKIIDSYEGTPYNIKEIGLKGCPYEWSTPTLMDYYLVNASYSISLRPSRSTFISCNIIYPVKK
jgi:hypothetical protein